MTHSAQTLPLISLVTPNYNGVEFLRETLESVVKQRYPALDFVIVDGASTDGSRLIIEQYREATSAIISEPDDGHADALNKGFAVTHGDIMGWINSDDVLHPGCLSQVARIFEAYPDVEWITGRPSTMNADSALEYVGPVRPWSRLRFLAGDHFWIQQESTFWRRSLWEKAGGQLDTEFRVANDFDLWARFFRHANLYSVDRMLGCFRIRPGQRSVTDLRRYKAEVKTILKRELTLIDPALHDAFRGLIPDTPRELTEDERLALNPQLSALDPPIIRMDAVRRRSAPGRIGAGGSRFGVGLARPEPISDLTGFRNKHAGERCFILGNGPSLNETDLSLLEGETVFACNAAFMLFDRIGWKPTYYTCVDSQVLPDRAQDIDLMLRENPSMTGFFPAEVQEHGGGRKRQAGRSLIGDGPNRYFFNEEPGSIEALPDSMFSPDAASRVIQPHTVAITMLQLAAYMGFSEIYLVGCDMRYSVPDTVRREGGAASDDPRLTSEFDDDPNHFAPEYFGAGRKWHVPNVMLMREHFAIARRALESRGVIIGNATVGGDLDVYDRVDLASLFDPTHDKAARAATTQSAARAAIDERTIPAAVPTSALQRRIQQWAPSLRSNWRFLAGAGLSIVAVLVFAILVPQARIWAALVSVGGLSLAFTAAIAIKTRRIIKALMSELKIALGGKAEAELTRQQLELEMDALDAQLRELRDHVERDGSQADRPGRG